MQKVILIHATRIPHYRFSIYRYLTDYLASAGYQLTVLSRRIEVNRTDSDGLRLVMRRLNTVSILKYVYDVRPQSVILFAGLSSFWLFPVILALRTAGIKVVYWGHGINLQKKGSFRTLYSLLHGASDAIILYAAHLRQFVKTEYRQKVFVANNTLNTNDLPPLLGISKEEILRKYGIDTETNIIFVGRVQKRKRVIDLVEAFKGIESERIGLILVGPDPEGILESVEHPRIYKLGPMYGRDVAELQSASRICCIPGAMGLGIVDAFLHGLPVITEEVSHGPEIMYLENGSNGFIVPKGDVKAIGQRIEDLLTDDEKLASFSRRARETIVKEGHIDGFCAGFVAALNWVCRRPESANNASRSLGRYARSPAIAQVGHTPSRNIVSAPNPRVLGRREIDIRAK